MDNKLREILQDLVNKDYNEHVEAGKMLIGASFGVLRKVTDEDKASQLLTFYIASVIAADGEASALEQRFLNDVFGKSASAILQLSGAMRPEIYDMLDKLVDMLKPEDKAPLMLLACTIAALDGTINQNEAAYIEKLLA